MGANANYQYQLSQVLEQKLRDASLLSDEAHAKAQVWYESVTRDYFIN